MGRGINKVIILGNLGQDPEVRFTPAGAAVANLSIATTDTWLDRQSGQRQERTEWHRVVLFNKTAEIAQQYLKKGSKVYIEGRLQTRKWQDQNGQDRYTTEIVGNDMQMLDTLPQGAQQGGYAQPNANQPPQHGQANYQPPQNAQPQQPQGGQAGYQAPPQNSQRQPAQQPQGNPANYGAPDPSEYADFNDEIPF